MDRNTVDVLGPHAGATRDRRASPKVLGAWALAAVTAPRSAGAKQKFGKSKAKRKCPKQIGQCRAFFIERCGGERECLAAALRCCQSLAGCHAGAFVECVFART
jgi:hypothetical protein